MSKLSGSLNRQPEKGSDPRNWTIETIADTKREDVVRSGILRRQARRLQKRFGMSDNEAADMLLLSRQIESNTCSGLSFRSLASSRYARLVRSRFIDSVYEAMLQVGVEDSRAFTLIPVRGWAVSGEELLKVNPKTYLQRFRQQLIRSGLKGCCGLILALLHGEYDPTTDKYQLHIHLIATGGAIDVVGRLRRRAMYQASGKDGEFIVKRPIKQQAITDPRRQISYMTAQCIWPSKGSYIKGSARRRAQSRRRIPHQRFGEFLLWLARISFENLHMTYGCRLYRGRIHLHR